MSENTMDDSNQVAPESVVPPVPTAPSAGSAGGSSAGTGVDLSPILKRLDAIEASIPDEVDRRFKSGQDRNVYRIEKEIEDIRKIVTASGGDFSKVETDLRISELTQQVEKLAGGGGKAAPGRAGLSPEWVAAQADTEIILDGAGIAFDDPGYIAFSARYAGRVKPEDWKGLVQSWVAKTKKQGQTQTGAAFSESSAPPVDATPDELKTAYDAELAKIPRGRVKDVHDLKMKYRRQGLNV